jgi:hypothetical protein
MYAKCSTSQTQSGQLPLNARNSGEEKFRIAALAEVIRSAAPLASDIAEL